MKRYTILVDGGCFMSLADIDSHSEAFAGCLAMAYATEAARLYAARTWDAASWDGPKLDLVVVMALMDENGKVVGPDVTRYTSFVPSQFGDDERRLLKPISIPGVTPIPLTIKEC